MAKVVLDPTGLYPIPSGYTPITTEVEWLQFFFLVDCTYWVRGKRLCDWTREWLRAWDKISAIIEEKQNPDSQPESLLQPISLPEDSKEVASTPIDSESAILVKQMYSSDWKGIDEFI